MKPNLRWIIIIGIILFLAAVIFINVTVKNSLKKSRNTSVVNTAIIMKKDKKIVKPVQPRPVDKNVEKEPPLRNAPLAY